MNKLTRRFIGVLVGVFMACAGTTAIAASPATATLVFPDGIDGIESVLRHVSQSSQYTVPTGKNLYILTLSNNGQFCNGAAPCYLKPTGGTNLLGVYFSGPLIVGAGTVLSSSSTAISFDLSGFLAPASVSVVITDLAPGASYTVPVGSTFYLMGVGRSQPMDMPNLQVGGVRVTVGAIAPAIIGSGQSITNQGSSTVTLDGYVK